MVAASSDPAAAAAAAAAPESAVDSSPAAGTAPKTTVPPSDNPQLGPLAKLVLPRIFKLYDLTGGAKEYEVYATDAVFEDPLMRANGVKQIKSAFYSMQVLFSEAGIREYSVVEEREPGQPEDSGKLVVDNVQHYKMFGKPFDMVSRINLWMDKGLVVRHEDLWDRKPLPQPQNRGIVGYGALACRRANMLLTHLFMGFGRDLKGKPASTSAPPSSGA